MGFDYTSLANNRFEMPNGWCVVLVQDVATVNEQSIKWNYRHKRIEYIDIASVEKGTVKSVQELPLDNAPSRARRIVRDNDTLVATVRPNLEHYVYIKKAKQNTIASTGFAVVTAKKVNPRFLYHYLTTKPFTAYLTQIADSHTSAYPAFNPDIIETAQLLLPPPAEQLAIAIILGTLDDKIELNRQMNKALEAMAQALFSNWFVDFKPFRDKGMEDSPLGPIPRGWGVAQIENLGDVICGKTPPTRDADNYEGHIPFITIPDMHDKVFVTQTGGYLTKKGAKTQPKKLLPRHAVCVSCIATPGLVALTSQPSHTNQQINSIICNDSISPFWCYLTTINLRQGIITGGAGGSATLNLNKNEFSKLQAIKPSQVVMWKFHQIVEPLFLRILSNELENIKLADIRDSLLRKLLSGEIRVKDAEKFVEVAV